MSFWKDLFATKSLEMLHAEMKGENRLRRVLGPIGLTSLGVGGIIGAGIFVMTGRVAANEAGPGILLSFVLAAVACALAAFCYAEFASLAPVAGSAYTYAYATLGELFAWIIGWDLILEYAMSGATVAAAWTFYFNEFLHVVFGVRLPEIICRDPISTHGGSYLNLPAALIVGVCTSILVIGIRESAFSNTGLVLVKLGVVVFVIVVGVGFINTANWTDIPPEARKQPAQLAIPKEAAKLAEAEAEARAFDDELARVKWQEQRADALRRHALALHAAAMAEQHPQSPYWAATLKRHRDDLPKNQAEVADAHTVLVRSDAAAPDIALERWGMLAQLGIDKSLEKVDDATRSNFLPYGFSGVMLGASLVFFAFIGFDSISTHSEEAIRPQRDVPFGILASLVVCTLLYLGVSAVITGMIPYPEIDTEAAIASAFTQRGEQTGNPILKASAGLIAVGALAGMTSVLLISFLSQARIFLAMARDGLLPHAIFGKVHDKFRTPHVSTIFMGVAMAVVAAFTPIEDLEKMVNIGTLFAFVVVCAAVLILRIKRPDAERPFRTPFVFVVAPLGVAVNLALMLFLPLETWGRLVIWLGLGLVFYFAFGYRYSALRRPPLAG